MENIAILKDNLKPLLIIWFVIWFYFTFILWSSNNNKIDNNNSNNNDDNIKEKANLYKKIEKEQLKLENLLIKKAELENEIDELNFESSTNLEKENKNNIKIRKLKLQIKQLNLTIMEQEQNINLIYNKIQWIN